MENHSNSISESLHSSSLYSKDLAPTPASEKTWNKWNLAALWVGMAVCIPTYLLASYMIRSGLSWQAALIIIGLANLVITIPMVLNGHAGVKYGIPFPVLGRAAFGTKGIHIPSFLRAIVACGWFGIQTWIGGESLYHLIRAWNPSLEEINTTSLFPQPLPLLCFGIFWLLNMFIVYKGVESIRKLLVFKAIFLPVAAIALFCWAVVAAKGLGPILSEPSKFTDNASFFKF